MPPQLHQTSFIFFTDFSNFSIGLQATPPFIHQLLVPTSMKASSQNQQQVDVVKI
jgi:hypothetical protein